MNSPLKAAAVFAIGLVAAVQANAQNFAPPPANGLAVLDLGGTALGTTAYNAYTLTFVATTSTSVASFLFRNDPGQFGFADASVVDATTPSGNLLANGNFGLGDTTGWSYFQQPGIANVGYVGILGDSSGLSPNGSDSYFWVDGATQGYDGLDQSFATTIGDTYTVSFNLSQVGGVTSPTTYQQTSANGDVSTFNGNGVDMLAYAGSAAPSAAVPEPATLLLLGAGSAALGVARRRRKRVVEQARSIILTGSISGM